MHVSGSRSAVTLKFSEVLNPTKKGFKNTAFIQQFLTPQCFIRSKVLSRETQSPVPFAEGWSTPSGEQGRETLTKAMACFPDGSVHLVVVRDSPAHSLLQICKPES